MFRFLLIIWFSATALFAQNTIRESSLILRLNLGIGSDWLMGPNQASVDLFNEMDIASLTYGLGASWQYQVSPKSILELGLNYQRRSVISKEPWTWPSYSSIDPYYGFVPETSETEGQSGAFRVIRPSYYLEIPMRWNYFLSPDREAWYISLGVSTLFNFGQRTIRRYEDDYRQEYSDFYAANQFRLQWQGLTAIGYRWAFSRLWLLDFGLQAQHSFSPSRLDVPNKHLHWLVAAEFALVRKL